MCDKLVVGTAAVSGHQSVKKAGVSQPRRPASVDNSSDETADDVIEQSLERSSVVAASLVVGSLIVVPLSLVLVITLCARQYRQGAADVSLSSGLVTLMY